MSKKLTRLMLLLILCLGLLLIQINPAGAQIRESHSAQTTPSADVITLDSTKVPFRIFDEEAIVLTGPFDSIYYAFAIPNSWALLPAAELHLDMTVVHNKISASEFGYPVALGGGTLNVYLNNALLGVLNMNDNGHVQEILTVPLDAFVSNRADKRMSFSVDLVASDNCFVDDDFSLIIHPTSYFSLPHNIVAPMPDITSLSELLYQRTFVQESALLVLPDRPSAAELQAALTVAGWLGNISGDSLPVDLTTMSSLTSEQKSSNHLILVGRPSAFTTLDSLQLPAPTVSGNYQIATENTDAGIIQLVNSPWDLSSVVVLVSGNSDAGVIKAAQALSTGVIRPHRYMNLAVVEDIQLLQAAQHAVSTPETRTLASMGHSNRLFDTKGFNVETYNFHIPFGWTVAEDAYFELAYGNSALLDFEQSEIIVTLNDSPIGSIRFDSETSKNAVNRVKIDIPQTAVVPGSNRLEVRGYIYPDDICTRPENQGLWINIWNDSVLSIPLTQKQSNSTNVVNMADYPMPFTLDNELNSTAFVLPKNDPDAWRSAAKISSYLASVANPTIVTLSAFFGEDFPEDKRQDYHVILIGRPSELPVVGELSQFLPVPFEAGSDKAVEGNMRVIYNIPADAPLGYVELLPSPWNSEYVIYAILGNSTQGLVWAGSAMTQADLRSQISGNLLIVNGPRVLASDTRVFPIAENLPSPEEIPSVSTIATSEPNSQNPQAVQSLNWIPLAILIGISLIVLIILIVVFGSHLKRRFGVDKRN